MDYSKVSLAERLGKFVQIETKLREYAHGLRYSCCPTDCPAGCAVKHNLDLDTSIAWEVADRIMLLRNSLTKLSDADYILYWSVDRFYSYIEELNETVMLFLRVLGRHDVKYSTLFQELRDLIIYIDEVKEWTKTSTRTEHQDKMTSTE